MPWVRPTSSLPMGCYCRVAPKAAASGEGLSLSVPTAVGLGGSCGRIMPLLKLRLSRIWLQRPGVLFLSGASLLCWGGCSEAERPPVLGDRLRATGAGGLAAIPDRPTPRDNPAPAPGAVDAGDGARPERDAAAPPAPSSPGRSEPPVLAPPLRSCEPSELCLNYCDQLGGAPECGMGGADQCPCICEEGFNRACRAELLAVSACVGEGPSPDCALRGRLFSGCESAAIALELCDARAHERLCGQQTPGCEPYCRGARLAFCEQGPASVASCLCGCETSLAVVCGAQLAAFAACAGESLRFTCDARGQVESETCSTEWGALALCRDSLQ